MPRMNASSSRLRLVFKLWRRSSSKTMAARLGAGVSPSTPKASCSASRSRRSEFCTRRFSQYLAASIHWSGCREHIAGSISPATTPLRNSARVLPGVGGSIDTVFCTEGSCTRAAVAIVGQEPGSAFAAEAVTVQEIPLGSGCACCSSDAAEGEANAVWMVTGLLPAAGWRLPVRIRTTGELYAAAGTAVEEAAGAVAPAGITVTVRYCTAGDRYSTLGEAGTMRPVTTSRCAPRGVGGGSLRRARVAPGVAVTVAAD
mmetsp:Transcript_34615/g.99429  ORF Transcript_34615/g.99429 Transcript_34615/m.99429 type:complete len:258 (-) Transcript_34615:330-1103(-)